MKRAAELFTIDRWSSSAPVVHEMWHAWSVPERSFISVAASHWQMVVVRRAQGVRLVVRGPETRATTVPIPQEAEFLGIRFGLGSYLSNLPPSQVVDRDITLRRTSRCFVLDGAEWEFPRRDNADVFVDRLVRAGLLVHDPLVYEALAGPVTWSRRTVERRTRRATGLPPRAIMRIRRAERAVELLMQGVPPRDVASRLGYADQPHLTRSLKHLVGCTPAQLRRSRGPDCRSDSRLRPTSGDRHRGT